MAVFKCKMCGGDLEVQEKATVSECAYCGTKQTVPSSDDEKKLGRPSGFTLNVREVYVSAGAEFVVALTGSIMTLPGLGKAPAAYGIDVDDNGVITGLF